MARGWESKAIEEQQLERDRRQVHKAAPAARDPEAAARRQGLELARARALEDLGRARTPAHRALLEATLAEIDTRLRTLDAGSR
jgi:hypothetical protein